MMRIPMIGIAIVIVFKPIWIVIVIDTHLESVLLFRIQKTQLIKDKEKVLNLRKLLSISGCRSFFVVRLQIFHSRFGFVVVQDELNQTVVEGIVRLFVYFLLTINFSILNYDKLNYCYQKYIPCNGVKWFLTE